MFPFPTRTVLYVTVKAQTHAQNQQKKQKMRAELFLEAPTLTLFFFSVMRRSLRREVVEGIGGWDVS